MGVHEPSAEVAGAGKGVEVDFEIVFEGLEGFGAGFGGFVLAFVGFAEVAFACVGFVEFFEVEEEEVEELVASGKVVDEAIGIFEHAAANHKTVEVRILGVELHGGGAVGDVAVDDELRLGAKLSAEGEK